MKFIELAAVQEYFHIVNGRGRCARSKRLGYENNFAEKVNGVLLQGDVMLRGECQLSEKALIAQFGLYNIRIIYNVYTQSSTALHGGRT